MRAFLCHSSQNKALVDSVAAVLGREKCIYDRYSFEVGAELEQSISKGLDHSSIFVFFASTSALGSDWVKLEHSEARVRMLGGSIKRAMCFIVDEQTTPNALPKWMQSILASKTTGPKIIASAVLHRLAELAAASQRTVFLGRAEEMRSGEVQLFTVEAASPHTIVLSGLPGVGRRATLEKIGREFWQFDGLCQVSIEPNETTLQVVAKLVDHLEVFSTPEALRDRIRVLEASPPAAISKILLTQASALVENRQLLCLVDQGGLLDSSGDFRPWVRDLLKLFQSNLSLYLSIVTERKPTLTVDDESSIAHVRVNPLSDEEIQRLLVHLANQHLQPNALTATDRSQLADRIGGYPPAAQLVIQRIAEYGKPAALLDAAKIADFKARKFARLLERQIVDDDRRRLIELLAVYSPLPMAVIVEHFPKLEPQAVSIVLSSLIDSALVVPDGDGYYGLSRPLEETATRFTGHAKIDHAAIARGLEGYLHENADERVRLSLTRALFRAKIRAGFQGSNEVAHLRTDLIRVAEDHYNARDYDRALEWSRFAVAENVGSVRAYEFLIRSMIQLGHRSDVLEHLEKLKKLDPASAAFLLGFLERKSLRHRPAIESYREAIGLGRRGGAVHRELALCYFALEDWPNAEHHLGQAAAREPDNRFVVDLQIKIAAKLRRFDVVKKLLVVLRQIDKESFCLHRESMVFVESSDWVPACRLAREAVALEPRPAFEMLTNLANCQIETKDFDGAAATLKRIEKMFGYKPRDVRLGLQSKLEARRGYYDHALSLLDQIAEKDFRFHKALRLEVLKGLVHSPNPDSTQRETWEREIQKLEGELAVRTSLGGQKPPL